MLYVCISRRFSDVNLIRPRYDFDTISIPLVLWAGNAAFIPNRNNYANAMKTASTFSSHVHTISLNQNNTRTGIKTMK